jgi:hypothetical protein
MASWIKAQASFFAGWKAGASSVIGARRAEMFGKGGVHEVGTTIFTVIALGGVPVFHR